MVQRGGRVRGSRASSLQSTRARARAEDIYDCQYRPSYFYIKDREVVHHTKGARPASLALETRVGASADARAPGNAGNTETTAQFVTHWAKHGCSPPDVEEVVPVDMANPPAPEEGEEGEEGAADKGKDDAGDE